MGTVGISSQLRVVLAPGLCVAALALSLAACGSSSGGGGGGGGTTLVLPTGSVAPPSRHHTSSPVTRAKPVPTVKPAVTRAPATGGCSLIVIENLTGESSAEDQARTAGWTPLQANGWTVFTPDSDWHLSASDAGADTLSPDGSSDASLATWYSQTPWTENALAAKVLGGVSGISVICRSPVEHGTGGTTQAVEFTGVYQGNRIHAILVISELTPTTPQLYVGETRSIYTPAQQWSTAAESTLWLIVKRAIQVPQNPNG